MTGAGASAEEVLARGSKSFALAGRLLSPVERHEAAVVYAWCRYVDDAIDRCPPEGQAETLARLRDELDLVYGGGLDDANTAVREFALVVRDRRIPREYPLELLAGMEMDVRGTHYRTMQELLVYCHRVAGTVGLMMCHVLGLRDPAALRHAAHLGIAMQLTNICRDVAEDWELGRLYLPEEVVASGGMPGLARGLGNPFPEAGRAAVRAAVAELLRGADRFYASGREGLGALSPRSALAIDAALRIYRAIGAVLRRVAFDPFVGRAVVPRWRKVLLALGSVIRAIPRLVADRRQGVALPPTALKFDDVVPL